MKFSGIIIIIIILESLYAYMINDRNTHTFSLYLLGIVLYSGLKVTENSKKRNSYYKTVTYHNFLFKWFLACLYHDVGYIYEKEKHYYDSCKNLDAFLEELEIKEENNLLEGVYKNGKEPRYYQNKQLVYNYYLYTLNERKRLDHGIAGGLLLYKNLIEMYSSIARKYDYVSADIVEDGLLYSPKLFSQYWVAADAIARHNIWMVNTESKLDSKETIEKRRQIYKAYQLNELIIDNDNRGYFNKDNLIWFLLCFADSIEPVKVYNTVKPEEVLKNIKINLTDNMIEFDFTHSVLESEPLYKKAKGLQDWLNVEIKSDVDADNKDCPMVFSINIKL